MPIVGAFARVESDDTDAIRRRLSALDGVTPFDLDEAGKVGVLIEAADLDAAHAKLTKEVKLTAGVLAVWPVYVDIEDMTVENEPRLDEDAVFGRRSHDATDAT